MKDNETIIKTLALCHFSDVKPRLMEALLTHFGNLKRIFKTDAGTLMSIAGMTANTANKISEAGYFIDKAEKYYEKQKKLDVKIVSRFDKEYPERLFELNDPPSLLYYRGNLFKSDNKLIALVGAENASHEGIELTTSIAKKLSSKNVSIVSSLNSGIDAAGHLGIKPSGGNSFAVLDCGLKNIYPEENKPLAIDIVQAGALISEHAYGKKYKSNNYKASNRLIAAMSQAVIVTEFFDDSKRILDLLKCCSEIGKMVFILINPKYGALTDNTSFDKAATYGAIAMVGLDKVDDIIKSLV